MVLDIRISNTFTKLLDTYLICKFAISKESANLCVTTRTCCY